jgi:hypothetical protein
VLVTTVDQEIASLTETLDGIGRRREGRLGAPATRAKQRAEMLQRRELTSGSWT